MAAATASSQRLWPGRYCGKACGQRLTRTTFGATSMPRWRVSSVTAAVVRASSSRPAIGSPSRPSETRTTSSRPRQWRHFCEPNETAVTRRWSGLGTRYPLSPATAGGQGRDRQGDDRHVGVLGGTEQFGERRHGSGDQSGRLRCRRGEHDGVDGIAVDAPPLAVAIDGAHRRRLDHRRPAGAGGRTPSLSPTTPCPRSGSGTPGRSERIRCGVRATLPAAGCADRRRGLRAAGPSPG